MVNLKKHLDLLGRRVEDRVTGFKGVVATVGFDLYGCIQAIVNPGIGKDGKLQEGFIGAIRSVDANGRLVVKEKPRNGGWTGVFHPNDLEYLPPPNT